jgi:hypothetical protein
VNRKELNPGILRGSFLAQRRRLRLTWNKHPNCAGSKPSKHATAYFIILATAVTLHVAGVTDIETAAQAAGALRLLAGDFAYIVFPLGILGVIGVPVPLCAKGGCEQVQQTAPYSITSSAVANSDCGMVRPSALDSTRVHRQTGRPHFSRNRNRRFA